MDLISWFILGSVLLFSVTLMMGMYIVNKRKDVGGTVGDNIAVGWFIIALLIMSFEYYQFKVGGSFVSHSTQSSIYVSVDGWDD